MPSGSVDAVSDPREGGRRRGGRGGGGKLGAVVVAVVVVVVTLARRLDGAAVVVATLARRLDRAVVVVATVDRRRRTRGGSTGRVVLGPGGAAIAGATLRGGAGWT
jgi:hypothetical protein